MTYTHLTTNELVMIEAYHHQNISVAIIAERLKRSRQPIYNVINFLKQGNQRLITTNATKKTKSVAVDKKSFYLMRNKNTLKKKLLKAGRQTSSLAVLNSQSVVQ